MKRFVLILALFASPAWSASFYITTTGSDTNACTNTTTDACATFARCAALMAPGDTCYAKGGTYTAPPGATKRGWILYPCTGGTSGNPMTFTSYPGELAIIQPQYYDDATQTGTITMNDSRCDWVTFTGLQIQGRLWMQGNTDDHTDNITIEKNIFKCPGDCGTGNTDNIHSTNLVSGTTNCTLDGLVIRDNYFTIDSTCPDYDTVCLNQEVDFVHLYGVNAPLVERNDFRVEDETKVEHSYSVGSPGLRFAFWTKGRAQNSVIRYNYCEGRMASCIGINTGKCPDRAEYAGPPECGDAVGPDSLGNNQAYQNVSYHAGGIGWEGNNFGQYDKVYNNTVVDTLVQSMVSKNSHDTYRGQDDFEVFNNIYTIDMSLNPSFGDYDGFVFWRDRYGVSYDGFCTNAFWDHNIYYGSDPANASNWNIMSDVNGRQDSSTLAEWQAYLASACASANVRDANSRAVDPLFVSKALKDFRLQGGSPARSGGRNADGYADVLGAYITGTEQIGCSFHPSCYSYNVAEAPSTSGNPRRVDMRGVSFK
jgi:hypothetical protein